MWSKLNIFVFWDLENNQIMKLACGPGTTALPISTELMGWWGVNSNHLVRVAFGSV